MTARTKRQKQKQKQKQKLKLKAKAGGPPSAQDGACFWALLK
jgi:hypothetical protein